MSQYDEENALDGERGGEVDEETLEQAWRNTEELEGDPVSPEQKGQGEEED